MLSEIRIVCALVASANNKTARTQTANPHELSRSAFSWKTKTVEIIAASSGAQVVSPNYCLWNSFRRLRALRQDVFLNLAWQ